MMTQQQRARLVKLLGMMGSAHDGERASAAALANRLVRDAGLQWDDVIAAVGESTPPMENQRREQPQPPEKPTRPPRKPRPARDPKPPPVQPTDVGTVAHDLLRDEHLLRPREVDLVLAMLTWLEDATLAQRQWLADIRQRVTRLREAKARGG